MESSKKIKFNKKGSRISCHDVSMSKILLEYICWVLAGKPDGHVIEED